MSTVRKPITAWRSWRVSNGFLVSSVTLFVWPPKLIVPGGDEGYYAFKLEDQALESGYHENGGVLGEVLLWGHVAEYTDGYRAQFAYPKQLYYFDDAKELDLLNLNQYGVPISKYGVTRFELEQQAAERKAETTRNWKLAARLARQERRTREQLLIQRARELGILDQIEAEAERQAKEKTGL